MEKCILNLQILLVSKIKIAILNAELHGKSTKYVSDDKEYLLIDKRQSQQNCLDQFRPITAITSQYKTIFI